MDARNKFCIRAGQKAGPAVPGTTVLVLDRARACRHRRIAFTTLHGMIAWSAMAAAPPMQGETVRRTVKAILAILAARAILAVRAIRSLTLLRLLLMRLAAGNE